MLKIDKTDVYGWEAAIRGMRNPMNSWEKSDSYEGCKSGCCDTCHIYYDCHKIESKCVIGKNDHNLMQRLAKAGTEHAKYLRMITVTADIVAPDYWWKEYATYKIGTTENSTSTMHRIHAKEFTLDDFSVEHLTDDLCINNATNPLNAIEHLIYCLNWHRELFIETKDKRYWWQMIQLLPMSYNYRRTVCLNYAVLANMYRQRKGHKLDEWNDFCKWIESLPYSELITGEGIDC